MQLSCSVSGSDRKLSEMFDFWHLSMFFFFSTLIDVLIKCSLTTVTPRPHMLHSRWDPLKTGACTGWMPHGGRTANTEDSSSRYHRLDYPLSRNQERFTRRKRVFCQAYLFMRQRRLRGNRNRAQANITRRQTHPRRVRYQGLATFSAVTSPTPTYSKHQRPSASPLSTADY